MIFVEWFAGFQCVHTGELRVKNSLIHIALRPGEFAVNREGARDVAGVAFVFATGVNQQQIAVLHFAVAVVVVQHAGVRAASDDVVVGRRARAVTNEFVRQLRLDLIFILAGARGVHRARMRLRRNHRRTTHQINFVTVLDQAHVVECRVHVNHAVWRGHTGARHVTHRIDGCGDLGIPRGAHADWRVHRAAISHQFRQFFLELFNRKRLIKTENFARCVGAVAIAVPDFPFKIFLATKQNRLALVAADQHEHAFGFCEARQVIKVAVMAI